MDEETELNVCLKNEIAKIKKRRSSLGRGLLTRRSLDTEEDPKLSFTESSKCREVQDNVDQLVLENLSTILTSKQSSNEENTECMEQCSSSKGQTDADALEQPKISPITAAYINKTKKLENEYAKWKELKVNRLNQLSVTKREYMEAKQGDTVIEEEEVLPILPEDFKKLMSEKPNYEQYLQEVVTAKDTFELMGDEVQKAILMCQSSLHMSKLKAEACYVILENESLGELKGKDPKDFFKEMLKLDS